MLDNLAGYWFGKVNDEWAWDKRRLGRAPLALREMDEARLGGRLNILLAGVSESDGELPKLTFRLRGDGGTVIFIIPTAAFVR